MHNHEASPYRNKTLPLKTNHEVRSANKIKISMKGLPKDFFHPDLHHHFLRPSKIRCKTQHSNQLQQTSYFQQSEALSPKREGREYKSEQRTRPSDQNTHDKDGESAFTNDTSHMNCTFFKSIDSEHKQHTANMNQAGSGRIPRKTNKNQLGLRLLDSDLSTCKSDIDSIFKARQGTNGNLNRLRSGLHRGLPLIRLCKPKAR